MSAHTAPTQQLGEGLDMQDDDLRTQLMACEAEMDALRARHGFAKEQEQEHLVAAAAASHVNEASKGDRDAAAGAAKDVHSPRLAPQSDTFEDDSDKNGDVAPETEGTQGSSSTDAECTNGSTGASGEGQNGQREEADGRMPNVSSGPGDTFDVAAAVAQRDALQRDIAALENTLEQLVQAEDFDTAAIVQSQIEKLQDDLATVSVSLVGRELDQGGNAQNDRALSDMAGQQPAAAENDPPSNHDADRYGLDNSTIAAEPHTNAAQVQDLQTKSSFSFVDEVQAVAAGGSGLSFSIGSDDEVAERTGNETAANAQQEHSEEQAAHGHGQTNGDSQGSGQHATEDNLHDAPVDQSEGEGSGDSHDNVKLNLAQTSVQDAASTDDFVDAQDSAPAGSAFAFIS
jgi:hypothetical protein